MSGAAVFLTMALAIYLTGMSGTSHPAWRWGTALGANVAGVIGCAGGLPNDWQAEVKSVPFASFGIAGVADLASFDCSSSGPIRRTWEALRSHPDWPCLVERAARSTIP